MLVTRREGESSPGIASLIAETRLWQALFCVPCLARYDLKAVVCQGERTCQWRFQSFERLRERVPTQS